MNQAQPNEKMNADLVLPAQMPRAYATSEIVFAWLCLFAGYLFCRALPISRAPLGTLCFLLFLYGATAAVFAVRKLPFRILPYAVALSAILFSVSLILSSNGLLRFLAYAYALVSYLYWVNAVCRKSYRARFSGKLLIDYFNALFPALDAIGAIFTAMFYGKAAKTGKTILRLAIGVGIAVIPTTIVLALLSYDSAFSDLLSRIFDFSFTDVLSHIFSMLLAVPIGMYLFGTYASSRDIENEGVISAEGLEKTKRSMQIAPVLTVVVSALPILFLYAVFFISQWQYYVSAFTGALPEGLSYAEYAREGFFQLCTVSFINLLILGAIHLFLRRQTKLASVILKLATVLYGVCTLVLISTALSKMLLYIDRYGLTRLRVYTTCAMLVLAVGFLLLILRCFIPKIPAAATVMTVALLAFGILCLGNADARIADYNADRYLDGTLESVDVDAMEALGDAGVPALVRVLPTLKENDLSAYYFAESALERASIRCRYRENGFFAYSLPAQRAKEALREAGFQTERLDTEETESGHAETVDTTLP